MVQGHYEPEFASIARELTRQLERNGGGGAVCVYSDGACVVDVWGGVRDDGGAPWQRDTMCVSYSTTKGVTATALHILVDRGLIDYDDPVARYWPEFAQAGKQAITVRDVLSHRAGLFDIRGLIDHADRMLDWDHMVEALARAAPASLPADTTAYQAITWGYMVGELIQRVSGQSLAEFLEREIATPLGLDGLYVGAPASQLHRAARLIRADKRGRSSARGSAQDGERASARGSARGSARDGARASSRDGERRSRRDRRQQRFYQIAERVLGAFGHPLDLARTRASLAPRGISQFDFSSERVLSACMPAANGLFTARSLARMYAALAAGGALDGVRLLSPKTVARATEIQTNGYDQIILFKMRWRLGYHRVSTFRGVPGRAFGHFGWGGSGAWADPERNVSLAFVVNSGKGTPIGDFRIMRLNTALLGCLRARDRRRRGSVLPWRRARG